MHTVHREYQEMGLLDRLLGSSDAAVERGAKKFGTGCAKAMVASYASVLQSLDGASRGELAAAALSRRSQWSVAEDGTIAYQGTPLKGGEPITDGTQYQEVILRVVAVELAARLGGSLDVIEVALRAAQEELVRQGLMQSSEIGSLGGS